MWIPPPFERAVSFLSDWDRRFNAFFDNMERMERRAENRLLATEGKASRPVEADQTSKEENWRQVDTLAISLFNEVLAWSPGAIDISLKYDEADMAARVADTIKQFMQTLTEELQAEVRTWQDWYRCDLLLNVIRRLRTCQSLRIELQHNCSTTTEATLRKARREISGANRSDFLGTLDPRRLSIVSIPAGNRVSSLSTAVLACTSLVDSDIDLSPPDNRRLKSLIMKYDPSVAVSDQLLPNDKRSLLKRLMDVVAIEQLAKHMRVIQWEVLMRNLDEEHVCRRYKYAFLGKRLRIQEATRVPTDFQDALSTAGFISTQLGVIHVREGHKEEQQWMIKYRQARHKKCYAKFSQFIDEIEEYYKDSRVDQIRMFSAVKRRTHLELGPDDASILVHDGEFTFFSFIWFFRHYHASRRSSSADHHDGAVVPTHRFMRIERSDADGIAGFTHILKEAEDSSPFELNWPHTAAPSLSHAVLCLYHMGLGILVEDKQQDDIGEWRVVITERWESYVEWLYATSTLVRQLAPKETLRLQPSPGSDDRTYVDSLRSLADDANEWYACVGEILQVLPVKQFANPDDYTPAERRWIAALVGFFLSDLPSLRFKEYVSELVLAADQMTCTDASAPHQSLRIVRTLREVANWFNPYSGSVNWFYLLTDPWLLTEPDNGKSRIIATSAVGEPHIDGLVCRLTRVPYFPMEMMFRAYQTYPMHLLIIPQNFIPTHWEGEGSEAPASVSFVTIAGDLPLGVFEDLQFGHRMIANESLALPSAAKDQTLMWLAPYWNLYLSLASATSMRNVEKGAREVGVGVGRKRQRLLQTHEIKNLLDALTPGVPGCVLEEIGNYFRLLSFHPSYLKIRPDLLGRFVQFEEEQALPSLVSDVYDRILRIWTIAKYAGNGQLHNIVTTEDELDTVSQREARVCTIKYDANVLVRSCEALEAKRDKTLLVCLLSSALFNIFKHTEPGYAIDITVSERTNMLTMRNVTPRRFEVEDKPISQAEVLREFVAEYSNVADSGRVGEVDVRQEGNRSQAEMVSWRDLVFAQKAKLATSRGWNGNRSV